MEILVIAPFFPYPLRSGGQVRLYHFIRLLSRRHTVSLVSFIPEGDRESIEHMRQFCGEIEAIPVRVTTRGVSPAGQRLCRFLPRAARMLRGVPYDVARFYLPELAARLNRLLSRRRFHVVHQEYMFMGAYLGENRRRLGASKTVLGEIDLSYVPLEREFSVRRGLSRASYYVRFRTMRRYALRSWRSFDHLVTASAIDRDKILSHVPGKEVSVVPNGVDIDYFFPVEEKSAGKNLAFVGSLGYAPNSDAVRFFCREIFPLVRARHPDATFTVVGADAPDGLSDEIPADGSARLAGYVHDIRPLVGRSAAFVVPLRIGGGTRLKILEAMAMGVPVVSTSVGCEGIEALPGRDVILEDDPRQFAQAVCALLENDEKRRAVAAHGLRLVRKVYSWEAIGRVLNLTYEQLARRPASAFPG